VGEVLSGLGGFGFVIFDQPRHALDEATLSVMIVEIGEGETEWSMVAERMSCISRLGFIKASSFLLDWMVVALFLQWKISGVVFPL
jgi:hypothetical protein